MEEELMSEHALARSDREFEESIAIPPSPYLIEQYPTQAETQEWLNELWSSDPDLWEYLMLSEEDEPAEFDFDALEERLYLMGAYEQ